MSVTPIVVNYHNAKLLDGLLQTFVHNRNVDRTIIVDNSGEVDSALFVFPPSPTSDPGAAPPQIDVVKPGKNIGFGAAVNLAARQTDSRYILVANPDVRLLAGCIDNLVSAAKKTGAVLVGPRIYWDDKKRFRLPPSQGASSWLDKALAVSNINSFERNHLSFYWEIRHERFWERQTPFIEIFLNGALMLIDRHWAMKADGYVFDERFFLYYEDNDLSIRALNAGFPPLCVPMAEAVHYYNQAPGMENEKGQLMAESYQKFSEKYYPETVDNPGAGDAPAFWKRLHKTIVHFFKNPEPMVLPVRGNSGCRELPVHALGCLSQPVFSIETKGPDWDWEKASCFFEVSKNLAFVPFTQSGVRTILDAANGCLRIPYEIWDRLAPGTYFSRIRDSKKGTIKIWEWKKP